jgi:hypothetical protein
LLYAVRHTFLALWLTQTPNLNIFLLHNIKIKST